MKILLVSSPIALKGIENLTRLPNLGLASIAGNLNPNEFEVKIVDLVACNSKPFEYFQSILKSFKPEVVGFSAMTMQYHNSILLARETKKINSEIKTLLGGYHATTAYKEILESKDMDCFDFIVRGEGEKTLPELLYAIKINGELSCIKGISFINKNGHNINNPDRELLKLDSLQLPDRKARTLDRRFHFLGEKADMIETSRGCTFGCDYCSINCMYGKNFRTFSLKRVIEDIKTLKEQGVKFLLLADDNITLDTEHLVELCQIIIKEKLNHINYVIQTGVKGLMGDPRLPDLMTEAGMKYIFLSLDNPENEYSKFYNVPEFEYQEALGIISEFRRRGAFIMGGFVVGHPDDKEADLWKTYRFAKHSGVDMVAFLILTPFPGTRIRDRLLDEGLITNLSQYSKYNNVEANIRTRYLTANELTNITKKMNARFLLENGTFFRFLFRFPKHILSRFIIEAFKSPGMLFERLKGILIMKG